MKIKLAIVLLGIAAILAWAGMAGAQTATPAPKVQLPSGEAVWDLNGDWDTLVENYGEYARFGTYPNVFRITHTTTGSTFIGIRLKDNPPPSTGRAGSPSLRGELGTNGFTQVSNIDSSGDAWPCKGQISEDGKKIILDNGINGRLTLTRP